MFWCCKMYIFFLWAVEKGQKYYIFLYINCLVWYVWIVMSNKTVTVQLYSSLSINDQVSLSRTVPLCGRLLAGLSILCDLRLSPECPVSLCLSPESLCPVSLCLSPECPMSIRLSPECPVSIRLSCACLSPCPTTICCLALIRPRRKPLYFGLSVIGGRPWYRYNQRFLHSDATAR